jgi:hypothetical protein
VVGARRTRDETKKVLVNVESVALVVKVESLEVEVREIAEADRKTTRHPVVPNQRTRPPVACQMNRRRMPWQRVSRFKSKQR